MHPCIFVHSPMQRKYAVEAAHGGAASREDESSLPDYAQGHLEED